MLNKPECHEAVGEQAHGLAPPRWRGATREGTQMGFDFAREFLGRAWRQRRMGERRLQACGHKAAAHIADSIAMAAQGLGDGFVREGFRLVMIQQQQNPSPRVCPGWSTARPD
jgi:hypothetical protein